MTAVLLTWLFMASWALVATGWAVCAQYRWVGRCEYLIRCEYRTWDDYWPIVVPAVVVVDLY
ncbi:hypothetical protein LWF15_00900 [Kineosporia rhizophila]|uniref:hypothetical protein n=1 Tax=Kineosporia TaxID=49184 RepID=UPI000AD501B2|nr:MULTISPECIES: hypothetical protein [Kineosporia]MCE0534064.1 hypothetical protein [Kineosporia rhizophila]GLY13606.1 hypothetical protein Kisp01_06220 [Kineosporia sp. NBRC 101677]